MINLIMPMAGGGVRFKNRGFNFPKPLIEINGKPFFYWAAQSVLKYTEVEKLVFVVLKEHEEQFYISEKIKEYYPDAEIVVLDKLLNGAVLTCREGISVLDNELPVVFNDCDHMFKCGSFAEFCKKAEFEEPHGILLTFKSDENKFSFIKYDDCGKFSGTIEKEAVSNDAICGVYYFKDKGTFLKYSEQYLDKCSYKEFFMSGVYNLLHENNKSVEIFNVDYHLSFGTPEEYEDALNKTDLFKEL